ncbi:hypothetical protein, partial [Erwinia amylovora]|uniref:hypothetical protein n=1 Tax=Erwinia amylovora TaxID=552 RepID=UPI0020C0B595
LTVVVANSVVMACPMGQNGKVTVALDLPCGMPELNLAAREGKVARKAGITIADGQGRLFEFAMQAEEWVVTGAKLPEPEDEQRDQA